MNQTNNPPIDAAGSVCFTLTRANGEIEIRGATAERVWQEQLKYPGHRFDNHTQLDAALWAVRGKRVA